MSTVTGRTYTVTMPRGFAPWRPRCATLGLLDTIRGVLAEYDDQLPLTARQVFYGWSAPTDTKRPRRPMTGCARRSAVPAASA